MLVSTKQHVEVPVPSPKSNEVLLRIEASSINPLDIRIQKGLLRPLFFPRKFPYIPLRRWTSRVCCSERGLNSCQAISSVSSLTLMAGIKLDGTDPPMNILVTAASGSVGHYAVQLAKIGNTHVTATCGARNIDFCTQETYLLKEAAAAIFLVDVKSEGTEYLAQLVKNGKLRTVIDSRSPLSKAEDAWAKSIDGHATGKIIVEP